MWDIWVIAYFLYSIPNYFNNYKFTMRDIQVRYDVSVNMDTKVFSLQTKPQVIFLWRSNVWKSSLLNSLFQRKDLVKTSSIPWKTTSANLFLVENKYHFVDFPGYGYAKKSTLERIKFEDLVLWYIDEFSYSIKKCVLVVDAQVGIMESDKEMFALIQKYSLPLIIVWNKSDKLKTHQQQSFIKQAEEIFFGQEILLTSTKTKTNISLLQRTLLESVKKK